ncbi:signal recognition particle 9 kDa protein-domain-containing protein [Astrocystis sublimbata]|nr:signal recognition particle 9 kDa protein-domain-containing protein [Astrocystis sublimbata]
MPTYTTSQEWLRQSALLIEARPSTTRITTKYHLTDRTGSSSKQSKRRAAASSASTSTTTPTSTPAPRASLTLKTFDPCSGACLKYRTTKAAEVSRLILSLGQLGQRMAGLPLPDISDAVMADSGADAGTPAAVDKGEGEGEGAGGAKREQTPAPAQAGGGAGGKGKKKRGKK